MDIYLKRISLQPGHKEYLEVGSSVETPRESSDDSLRKMSAGVSSQPGVFTFVPVMQKLPIKNTVTEWEETRSLAGEVNENLAAAPEESSTKETMTDGGIFKAEIVFIKDTDDRGTVGIVEKEKENKLKHLADRLSPPPQSPPPFSVQAENPAHHNTARHFTYENTSMATAVNKHRGITQPQCHSPSLGAVCGSSYLANRAHASEDRTSPTPSAGSFPTPASSRESVLSEGWDKERSWSAMQLSNEASPPSMSRTVSPCSSVRSGVFSPAVVRVTRHSLAPGSSLLHMPSTCFSSCDSLASSLGPQSPPPSRRRPPLTRLSLLTAILRKGRLPILSPALQRPYSPCWPINSVSLSSCNACSAASSVACIPLTESSSSALAPTDKHLNKQPHRCAPAPTPAPVQLKGLYSLGPRIISPPVQVDPTRPTWARVVPPPPPILTQSYTGQASGNTARPRGLSKHPPLPISANSTIQCEIAKARHSELPPCLSPLSFESGSHRPEPSNSQTDLKGSRGDSGLHSPIAKLTCVSPEPINERKTLASREWSPKPRPYTSLPGVDSHSPKPTDLHCCLGELQPSVLCSPTAGVSSLKRPTDHTVSPTPSQYSTKERCQSAPIQRPLESTSCLTPSRYTPIAFPGWPSPTPSPPPTHDRFTLSPSPAPPLRDLTSSPSLSVRSTPSPKPWIDISDCIDREGKKRKLHKIKLSYKSLAAIPTNTLLLDQQAIDDKVDKEDLQDTQHSDTHAEMCSPAQLRQQSEELYAVIDEVLEDSTPKTQTSRAPPSSREMANKVVPQQNTSPPRPLGRETKYATCNSLPSTTVERKLMDSYKTKPGVIRPLIGIPRLTVEDNGGEQGGNPFRQYLELSVPDNTKSSHPIVTIHEDEALNPNKIKSMSSVDTTGDAWVTSEGQKPSKEKIPETVNTFSMSTLLITEPQDRNTL